MTHYLKIIFILSSSFLFNSPSLAASRCKPVFSDTPKKIISSKRSVWKITNSNAFGTGFFISPNQFVTNFHVIEGLLQEGVFNAITVSRDGTHEIFKIKSIQKLSALYDLAVLEIEGETKDYLKLQNKPLSSAKGLTIMGYPQRDFSIIKKEGRIVFNNEYQYKFPINYQDILKGSSGSPVLNNQGEVSGVLVGFNGSRNIVVVKINALENILNKKTESASVSATSLLKEFQKELVSLHKMAMEGSPYAQAQLALMYKDGIGVYKDDYLSFYWYKKAAKQGYVEAQFQIAVMYNEGIGVSKNKRMVFYWLKKAAEQGYVEAQSQLGFMYSHKKGLENDNLSLYWLKKAARQGYAEAQFRLGFMYHYRKNIKNNELSLYWFKRAARQGLTMDQILLSY